MTNINVANVSVTAGDAPVLNNVSFSSKKNELIAIVGPNGAGKTTLLKTIAGLTLPNAGHVMFGAKPLADMAPLERARHLAYLPQHRPIAWPMRVRDIVALGRFAFGGAPGRLSTEDAVAVDEALNACELTPFAKRQANTLSGGELARVHIARAFAAKTPVLVADEPIAALDPRMQLKILSLIKEYVERGGSAIIVVHDIALAANVADRMIWIRNGEIVADDAPTASVTQDRLSAVFDVDAIVETIGDKLTIRFQAPN